MFMLLALGLLGVVDSLVLCQNRSMAKTLNISLSVFTGRSRSLKGCGWASLWSTVKPRMLNQTWWTDVIPRPWSKTSAPFIQALRYHVRISPQKTHSDCFIVFHPIPYLLFSSSCSCTVLIPKEKPPITVVGDVGGRIAIIVVSSRWLEYLQDSVALVSLMYYHNFLLIFRMRFYVLLSLELSTFVLQRKLKEN